MMISRIQAGRLNTVSVYNSNKNQTKNSQVSFGKVDFSIVGFENISPYIREQLTRKAKAIGGKELIGSITAKLGTTKECCIEGGSLGRLVDVNVEGKIKDLPYESTMHAQGIDDKSAVNNALQLLFDHLESMKNESFLEKGLKQNTDLVGSNKTEGVDLSKFPWW